MWCCLIGRIQTCKPEELVNFPCMLELARKRGLLLPLATSGVFLLILKRCGILGAVMRLVARHRQLHLQWPSGNGHMVEVVSKCQGVDSRTAGELLDRQQLQVEIRRCQMLICRKLKLRAAVRSSDSEQGVDRLYAGAP